MVSGPHRGLMRPGGGAHGRESDDRQVATRGEAVEFAQIARHRPLADQARRRVGIHNR